MKNTRLFICLFFFFIFLYIVVIIIIFIISAQKHRLWYAFKPPRRVPTINVCSRNMKNIRIFFYGKIFDIFELACFQVLLVCVCVCV